MQIWKEWTDPSEATMVWRTGLPGYLDTDPSHGSQPETHLMHCRCGLKGQGSSTEGTDSTMLTKIFKVNSPGHLEFCLLKITTTAIPP